MLINSCRIIIKNQKKKKLKSLNTKILYFLEQVKNGYYLYCITLVIFGWFFGVLWILYYIIEMSIYHSSQDVEPMKMLKILIVKNHDHILIVIVDPNLYYIKRGKRGRIILLFGMKFE